MKTRTYLEARAKYALILPLDIQFGVVEDF